MICKITLHCYGQKLPPRRQPLAAGLQTDADAGGARGKLLRRGKGPANLVDEWKSQEAKMRYFFKGKPRGLVKAAEHGQLGALSLGLYGNDATAYGCVICQESTGKILLKDF